MSLKYKDMGFSVISIISPIGKSFFPWWNPAAGGRTTILALRAEFANWTMLRRWGDAQSFQKTYHQYLTATIHIKHYKTIIIQFTMIIWYKWWYTYTYHIHLHIILAAISVVLSSARDRRRCASNSRTPSLGPRCSPEREIMVNLWGNHPQKWPNYWGKCGWF